MSSKQRWWHKLYFEFYLNTYLLRIETHLLTHPINSINFVVCRLRITVLKWKLIEFDLYRRDR